MLTVKQREDLITEDGEALVELAVSSAEKDFSRLIRELWHLGFSSRTYLDDNSHDRSDLVLEVRAR